MRDAVGGSFMIKLIIVFLVLYTIFVAVALNYAKAFRVKNKVLDIIEQNEGIKDYDNASDTAITQISAYMNSVSYKINKDTADKKCKEAYGNDVFVGKEGYCIIEVRGNNDINADYYKVATFVTIDFPFLNLSFTIPIQGETRKIERINT